MPHSTKDAYSIDKAVLKKKYTPERIYIQDYPRAGNTFAYGVYKDLPKGQKIWNVKRNKWASGIHYGQWVDEEDAYIVAAVLKHNFDMWIRT